MDLLAIITAILTLLAGIGVFLIACTMMSSNLESASSKRLKRLFAKTGDNKWLGVAIGTVGTEYISLAQNSERVADHLINVAKTIRQLQ